ncbi:MAG TPA: tRNA uridine-5-carboxymethylaminomethyl(34) synthesis GTPase MnmE [Nitrospinota bacterium]|nr:tRNA uridine-5-carboxymethylaminomethyl(34) synthesis GTPase MnmE [Nitrospinota bacterium]|tara:strand:- start:239851 stop:241257 length:1407 start_codon:yes stop_codon:yes gene_type:complete
MGTQVKQEETIVAVSSPTGEGGVGMIRMSGIGALNILQTMFRGPSGKPRNEFESHRVYYGFVADTTETKIDETLVVVMKSPKTYTREDVVEISCHGGIVVLRKILQACVKLGARMAEAGEFSKRAFLNGRIDLVQAEAIIDMIKTKSDKGWRTAFSQLDGKLSKRLDNIENLLVSIIADIEVSIDFPDEDIELANDVTVLAKLQKLSRDIDKITCTYGVGRIYRDGISIAITGKPNVGKSSLMNALLERDRVIVTDTPGTTRDSIEESLQIGGVAVKIVDTAGVRKASDNAEQLGVSRALKVAFDSDIRLIMFDGSKSLDDDDRKLAEELYTRFAEKGSILTIINKNDLPQVISDSIVSPMDKSSIIRIAAKTGDGVDLLKLAISKLIEKMGINLEDGPVLTRERHLARMRAMTESVGRAISALKAKMSREFIAADLQEAKESLEELTGKVVDDQVIDKIFNEMCIGK